MATRDISSLSKDGNCAGRTGHAASDVQRSARAKERPPPLTLALLCQLLQVPQLSQRRPPPDQRPVVEAVLSVGRRRPCLKRHRVSDVGGKVPVVHPVHHLLVRGHAHRGFADARRARLPLRWRRLVVTLHVARPNHQNVTLSCLGACLVLKSGLQIGHLDLVPRPRVRGTTVSFLIESDLTKTYENSIFL